MIQFILTRIHFFPSLRKPDTLQGEEIWVEKKCVGKIANILDDKMWCYIKGPLSFKEICSTRAINKVLRI